MLALTNLHFITFCPNYENDAARIIADPRHFVLNLAGNADRNGGKKKSAKNGRAGRPNVGRPPGNSWQTAAESLWKRYNRVLEASFPAGVFSCRR